MMTRDDLMEMIRRNIAKHGFHAMYIGPVEGQRPSTPFCYTVGFREYDLPELIGFGLPPETGHKILWNAFELFKEHGAPADGFVSESIANMPTTFRSLDPELACKEHLRFARVYYGDVPPAVMQIIWPDQDGLMPWDAGSDRDVHKLQCEIVDWRGGRP